MNTLGIDTGSHVGSVAVSREAEIVGCWMESDNGIYSSRLCGKITALLSSINLSLDQMDVLAVSAGPGSFTGLRIGLTSVKAWAEILGKPIAPVSSLAAVAYEGLRSGAETSEVIAVLDARRGQVYGGIYRRGSDHDGCVALVGEEIVASPGEFLEYASGQIGSARPVFASPTPHVLEEALRQSAFCGAAVTEVPGILAPAIALVGRAMAKQGKVVDALRVDASYIRRSDAEMKWKDRGPSHRERSEGA
jgi:tRNA threonylcarbamoyladenosine biosynthesis protein TsaB